MSSAPILPARLNWPSAIGNFLINFGMLDYLVAVYLKDNLEPAEFERFKKQHFKDRIKRIEQHLLESSCPADKWAEFEHVLRRLDPIRNLRNHIAHGHFLILQSEETKLWELSIALPEDLDQEYSPETRHVTFDELRTSLDELTELIEAFKRLAGFKSE